jgi:signal transduction histidine kinase
VRRQLVIVAIATTAMVAFAFLLPLGALVRTVARDKAIADAERDGRRVADAIVIGASPAQLADVADDTARGRPGEVVQLFLADGTVIGEGRPADDAVEFARTRAQAFSTNAPHGADTLTPVPAEAGTDVVRVFVSDSLLEKGVWRSWLVLGGVAVALVAVAVLVADRLANSIVEPVAELAATTQRLASGAVEARVEPGGPPEIVEVGVAVNTLADRLDGLLAAERELVADLSHRLRTPLAALQLDSETIADPEVRRRVGRDVEALEKAVGDIIAEARSPRTAAARKSDLVATTRDRAAFWAVLAEDQRRPWRVQLPDAPLEVKASRGDLGAALDALFDNVFAHTPDGSGVWVAVLAANGSACLVLDDDGPGFRDISVINRGVSGGRSSGLGLDIVHRTMADAGGTLGLFNRPEGGARIELRFPPALPASSPSAATRAWPSPVPDPATTRQGGARTLPAPPG